MPLYNYDIRPMTKEDLNQVFEIEKLSFVAPWKDADIVYELEENKFANLFVVTIDERVVGYADYWKTFESGTLCKIAIHPDFRGNKLGSFLLDEILKDCYIKRIRTITLEVRKSNQNARILYKNHGFKELLIKPNYYSNGEDAIYMSYEVNINA